MASVKIVPNKGGSSVLGDSDKNLTSYGIQSILHCDSNYCVIDKPRNVRMNGDFSVTVEKLMLHWIPGIRIDELKWIHQLDYATSGVLCVGLNKKSAAVASAAFEARTVNKQYLAVLQGHVDLSQWPILEERKVFTEEFGEDPDDSSVPSKRKLDTTKSFSSNQSGQAVQSSVAGDTWQSEVMDLNLRVHFDAFTAWKTAHCDPTTIDTITTTNEANGNTPESSTHHFTAFQRDYPDKWKQLQPLLRGTYELFQKHAKGRKALRKFLRNSGIDVDTQASTHHTRPEKYDQFLQAKEQLALETTTEFEVTAKTIEAMRALYKDPASGPGVYRVRGAENRLVINVPVAEILGDFR